MKKEGTIEVVTSFVCSSSHLTSGISRNYEEDGNFLLLMSKGFPFDFCDLPSTAGLLQLLLHQIEP